jgi:hypothetical protein
MSHKLLSSWKFHILPHDTSGTSTEKQVPSNYSCSGCPKKVNDHMKRRIIREATKAHCTPFSEIGNQMVPKMRKGMVRNVLAEAGYHRQVAKKVPYLMKCHKAAQRYWVKLYRWYDNDQWGKVIWSDECYIHLADNRGQVYVTR